MTSSQTCPKCGANAELAADGRTLSCGYCGLNAAQRVEPSLLANALHAEFQSIETFLEHLAEKLQQSFPEHVRVEKSGGFFSAKKVSLIEITLENWLFRMRHEHGQVHAERLKLVRGVALKTETLEARAWIDSLSEGLSSFASTSASAHDALSKFVSK